jgi:hypothetical protein
MMTRKLIKKGLNVYEMHDKLLHMKAYYADDEVVNKLFKKDIHRWFIQ